MKSGENCLWISVPMKWSHSCTFTRAIPVVRDRQLESLDEVRDVQRTDRGITGMSGRGRRSFTGSEVASMNCWVFPRTVMTQLAAAFSAFLDARGRSADAEAPLPELIHDLVRAGRLAVDVIEAPGDLRLLRVPHVVGERGVEER